MIMRRRIEGTPLAENRHSEKAELMRIVSKSLLVGVLVLVARAAAGQMPALKSLYEQHRWAELREGLRGSKEAPALYQGAVASAWNDTRQAEKYLKQVIESAPDSEDAAEAHEQLGHIYARSGRYRDVVRQLDSILRIKPGRPDVENIRTCSQRNLFFDGLAAVTRVEFAGKELDFVLDTGNLAGAQLWKRFADDFATLLKQRGTQSKQTLTEVGGSRESEATVLPEIQLRIGGFDTTLRPAPVFSKPVGDDFHHGLLGMDLLSQAREVRVDFRSMTLELLP